MSNKEDNLIRTYFESILVDANSLAWTKGKWMNSNFLLPGIPIGNLLKKLRVSVDVDNYFVYPMKDFIFTAYEKKIKHEKKQIASFIVQINTAKATFKKDDDFWKVVPQVVAVENVSRVPARITRSSSAKRKEADINTPTTRYSKRLKAKKDGDVMLNKSFITRSSLTKCSPQEYSNYLSSNE